MENKENFISRLNSWRLRTFPERQLFLRSEGRVRFLTIGSITQQVMATSAVAMLIWGAVTSYSYLTKDVVLEQKKRTILNISAQYESLSDDFSALEQEVERRAELLEERQKFLEDMSAKVDAVSLDATEAVSEGESNRTDQEGGNQTSAIEEDNTQVRRMALLTSLKDISDAQIDYATRLLAGLRAKEAHINDTIAPTKVTADQLMDKAPETTSALGGPYVPDAELLPIFEETDNSILFEIQRLDARVDAMVASLGNFPTAIPAEKYYISSNFGRRVDPFKKTWARHSGLDMAGWPGTKILAGASGKVVKAGTWGPYGRMVEIDHENGFKTRYGHMRKLKVKRGDIVEIGQQIGEMGKTGRATSSHLHYEVWFDGKLMDPKPFLEAAENVRKIQGRHEKTNS